MHLRRATPADVPVLQELIQSSVRKLQAADYSSLQIEGALGSVFGVDNRLIADATYLVVEAAGRIVGCGGWSKRKTLFGAGHQPGREDQLLDPSLDAARIRAFFVHPDWTRKGIGSRILEACEEEARRAGFSRFELGATLTGEPMYRARGYIAVDRIQVPLGNGESLPVVRMVKSAPPTAQK